MKRPANLPESLSRRLNSYALAASAAGVGVLALAQPSAAKIVYTKAHIRITPNTAHDLSLSHNGVTDFSFSDTSAIRGYKFGAALVVAPALRGNMVWVSTFNWGYHFAGDLNRGQPIGPSPQFAEGSQLIAALGDNLWSSGPWCKTRQDRYLGLKFDVNGAVGSHFGWVRMNVACDGNVSALITGYAYETIANKPILAGQTKEPEVMKQRRASLAHLARGASAIPAWRTKP